MNRQRGIYYVYNGSTPCRDCKFHRHSVWQALAGESPKCAYSTKAYGVSKEIEFGLTNCAFERGLDSWPESCGPEGKYWVPKYRKDFFKLLGAEYEDTHTS